MARILVVDDEPAVVAGIQVLMELNGLDAVGATDCESAEEQLANEFFPVILADLRMQRDDDGLRIIDAVRRLSPRSRVVTMTGYADPATIETLRARGAALVVQKPLAEDELIPVLQEMLATVADALAAHPDDDDDALYAATIRPLRAIACGRYGFSSHDADELVQEAWLLFLEKRQNVRTPRTWLSGTIANLCRREIDRRVRDRARDGEMPCWSTEPADDTVLAVRQALARLDPRSRELCTRIGIEEQSYEEVSRAAGIPLGSIGPSYMRAKGKLRKEIGGH